MEIFFLILGRSVDGDWLYGGTLVDDRSIVWFIALSMIGLFRDKWYRVLFE